MIEGELDVSAGVKRLQDIVAKTALPLPQEEKNKRALAANDLPSYSLLGDVSTPKTNEEKWKAICLHRSRFADGSQPSAGLDLAITPVQQRKFWK